MVQSRAGKVDVLLWVILVRTHKRGEIENMRTWTHNPRQNFRRSVVGKGHSDEVLGKNEKLIVGQW